MRIIPVGSGKLYTANQQYFFFSAICFPIFHTKILCERTKCHRHNKHNIILINFWKKKKTFFRPSHSKYWVGEVRTHNRYAQSTWQWGVSQPISTYRMPSRLISSQSFWFRTLFAHCAPQQYPTQHAAVSNQNRIPFIHIILTKFVCKWLSFSEI